MKPIFSSPESEKTPFRLNAAFAEYLEGKTVAVVGRGGLDDLEQGEFIDSHDVVARVHDMAPHPGGDVNANADLEGRHVMNVPPEWQSRIGKKCHVIYHAHIVDGDNEFVRKCVRSEYEAFRRIGGRFICATNWMNHTQKSELIWQSEYDVRYLTIDHFLNTMRELEDSAAYAGTLVVTDILRHNVKSLYITGMPMFVTKSETKDPLGRVEAKPVSNLKFLVKLSEQYPGRVTIDSYMREIWSYHKNGCD